MGLDDLFRKGKKPDPALNTMSKEEIFKMVFDRMGQESPSKEFASGAIFDIVRKNRDIFVEIVRSNNAITLHDFFAKAYMLFCKNPQIVGLPPATININKNDTNPAMWNADTFSRDSGEVIALCYMPIVNETLEARIIGIVITGKGDRYYYCMLNKDTNTFSDVIQNKAWLGLEKVGEVKGRGFELMNSFLKLIEP